MSLNVVSYPNLSAACYVDANGLSNSSIFLDNNWIHFFIDSNFFSARRKLAPVLTIGLDIMSYGWPPSINSKIFQRTPYGANRWASAGYLIT